jgi:hypothetical protein
MRRKMCGIMFLLVTMADVRTSGVQGTDCVPLV